MKRSRIVVRLNTSPPNMARTRYRLEDWLSGAQVAALLAVTPSRVGQLRREHQLPATRTPLGYLFHVRDVHRFVDARQHQPPLLDVG